MVTLCIRLHTSAYVCIRPRIRQHTSRETGEGDTMHTSAYVRIHTSAYVCIRPHTPGETGEGNILHRSFQDKLRTFSNKISVYLL